MSKPLGRIAFLLVALLLLGRPGGAAAHAGGTLQLANATVGPYLMSLWTLPEPPRAGEPLHVSLFLLTPTSGDGASQDFILDANVAVEAAPAGEPSTQREPGRHIDPDDPFYYEADLQVDQHGVWDITILVDGPDGGGDVSFAVEVLPAAGGSSWLYWLVGLVVVAGGAFLVYRRGARGAAAT